MSVPAVPAVARPAAGVPAVAWRLARTLVHRRLAGLEAGEITVTDHAGVHRFGPGGAPRGALTVRDPGCYARIALAGANGFAEAYRRGEWDTPDLAALLGVFAGNVARHRAGRWTHAALARPLARIAHALRRNTRSGSRRNIRAHYDLGNDFYALFLDDTMTYSCGVFERPDATMREASIAKLDRVCRKLELGPGCRVLEIGGGWGSFAIHAATRYGCDVTTTTISPAQRGLAIERVRAAGCESRVRVLDRDYRDLEGIYDRVVSIEMIEAVGYEHLGAFFRAAAARLAADGRMLLQAITIPDRDEATYRATADFIQREIFPGSALPSLGAMVRAMGAESDLRVVHVESLGRHYAATLRRWRAAFTARREAARALGFDERFLRAWLYYLCYCEAGFDADYTDVLQIVLARPGAAGNRDTAR